MAAAGISASQTVEAEVKVQCSDPEALISSHPEYGWRTVEPRHFEDNLIFDLPADALKNRGSILRIRIVDGKGTLTYKGLVPESYTSEMKVRRELETGVHDPETLGAIFTALGFRRVFRYQKYRTVYGLTFGEDEVLAMRDELPFGDFLELEGDESVVSEVARSLGFSSSDFIRESYIGLQAAMCAARGGDLEDLVFA